MSRRRTAVGRHSTQQFAQCGAWIRLTHEVLADERDVNSVRAQTLEIFGRANARLAHEHAGVFEQFRETHRMLKRSLHRSQIAIVDAEQRVTRARKADDVGCAQEIFDIVHFDERRHAEFGGENLKVNNVAFR